MRDWSVSIVGDRAGRPEITGERFVASTEYRLEDAESGDVRYVTLDHDTEVLWEGGSQLHTEADEADVTAAINRYHAEATR